jgi:hypothetical protein
MEWIAKIIEAAKLPTKFIVVIFLVSLGLIFIPESGLTSMKLKSFADTYGLYVGITALSSGALLLIEASMAIWRNATNKIAKSKLKKQIADRMASLDGSEKSVLREFYLQGQNTIKLPVDHPVVAGLLNSGVVVLVGQHGRMSVAGMLFSMMISESAKHHITHELIDWPMGEPTEQELRFICNNRPSFISRIQLEEHRSRGGLI